MLKLTIVIFLSSDIPSCVVNMSIQPLLQYFVPNSIRVSIASLKVFMSPKKYSDSRVSCLNLIYDCEFKLTDILSIASSISS